MAGAVKFQKHYSKFYLELNIEIDQKRKFLTHRNIEAWMHPRWGEVVHVCVIAPEFLHYLFDDDYVDD